jgi:hypothetical protein
LKCSRCGAENPDDKRFCGTCAERLKDETSALEALKSAFVLPFSPHKSFSSLHRNASVLSAVIVAITVPLLWGVFWMANGGWSGYSLHRSAIYYVESSVRVILTFVLLVLLSVAFDPRRPKPRARYSSNTRLIGFWYAWEFSLSGILALVLPVNLGLPGLVFGLLLWAWLVWLFAVALSVAENLAVRKCLVPAICALICASLISSWLTMIPGPWLVF